MASPQYGFKASDLVNQGRTTQSNIDQIKRWLAQQRKIPLMSEEEIALFLLACNNDIEAAKNTINYHFKYASAAPEFFKNRTMDTKDNQHTASVTLMGLSPNRTKENYAVAIAQLKDTSYSSFNLDNQIRLAFTALSVLLYSDPPDGFIFLINMKGVGLMHLTRLKLGSLRKFISYVQDALPTQLKRVHVINANYIFEKILSILRPFMKKELFDLIVPHSVGTDMNEFFEKHIPADCIPCDFGGELPSLQILSDQHMQRCRQLTLFLEAGEKQIDLYDKDG